MDDVAVLLEVAVSPHEFSDFSKRLRCFRIDDLNTKYQKMHETWFFYTYPPCFLESSDSAVIKT
jgi:hypothetical protein